MRAQVEGFEQSGLAGTVGPADQDHRAIALGLQIEALPAGVDAEILEFQRLEDHAAASAASISSAISSSPRHSCDRAASILAMICERRRRPSSTPPLPGEQSLVLAAGEHLVVKWKGELRSGRLLNDCRQAVLPIMALVAPNAPDLP